MRELLALFEQARWQDGLDILLVAFVIYQVIILVKGTRALQMLMGLGVVFLALGFSQTLDLFTINWIINSFLSSFVLVLIILFQNDIRKALFRLGQGPFFSPGSDPVGTLDEVIRSCNALAANMLGGLIVFRRNTGLAEYMEKAAPIDAPVSRELLLAIFQPPGPLHDGAVVVHGDRIEAARCILPLSQNPNITQRVGTRHRAALGLAEETDAVCLVVSEERGRVSLAVDGTLHMDLDSPKLRRMLGELLGITEDGRRRWWQRKGASGA